MRIDIDARTDHASALIRARGRKQVGRKHNHQPRGRAHQRMLLSPKRRQQLENQRRKKFSLLVAAYFAGTLEVYP